MAPVAGSVGAVPETNTSPAALTAWLYAGGGLPAFGVNTIWRAISLPLSASLIEKLSSEGLTRMPGGALIATQATGARQQSLDLRENRPLSSLEKITLPFATTLKTPLSPLTN